MRQPPSEDKKQEWQERFRRQRESGQSIKQWCRENQIITQTFYYWRVKLFSKPLLNRPDFTELADIKESALIIECEGIRIHLDKDFDSCTLKRCLAILKEMKC